MKQHRPIAGSIACLALAVAPSSASEISTPQSLCAVSNFNAKLEGAGGHFENDFANGGRWHGIVSATVPLGCRFGLQIDAGYGEVDGSDASSVTAHAFVRNPQRYLLGVYGQWSEINDSEVWRVGGEGELYFGNISVEGLVAFEDTDFRDDDVFVTADIAFYPTDNIRLSGGFARFIGTDAGTIGIEWQPDSVGLSAGGSLFVNAAIGNDDFATVLGGVRIYFGEAGKSLIRRHREDDPGTEGSFFLLNEEMPPAPTVAPTPTPSASPPSK